MDAKSGLRYKFIEYIPGRTVVTPTAAAAAAAVVPNEEPEVNPEEMQYLDVCMLDILANDVRRGDRAGTGRCQNLVFRCDTHCGMIHYHC